MVLKAAGVNLDVLKTTKAKRFKIKKKVKLEILVRGTLKEITTLPNVGNWDF